MKLSIDDRFKIDMADDEIFYQQARYVHHLSVPFRARLTKLYTEYLCNHHIILDLMSSWVSHLPNNKKYNKVIAHGMNQSELNANERIDSFWIQNLNKSQQMPIEDSSIDIVLVVAGWQYLQYPEKVSLELSRITKSNSFIIVSFTNRAFWTKSPNIWCNSSETRRIDYVKKVLSAHGWSIENILIENTYERKIFGIYTSESDPFYSVIAKNNKSNN